MKKKVREKERREPAEGFDFWPVRTYDDFLACAMSSTRADSLTGVNHDPCKLYIGDQTKQEFVREFWRASGGRTDDDKAVSRRERR